MKHVVRALFTLPPERVAEMYDFILFLQARCGQVVGVSDAWNEEDLSDLREASPTHVEEAVRPEEDPYGSDG